ncbi:MAG TPA: helix-turn-helix domain-containing protein [Polyangiaceae bacterium]|nr:helix-turn-helix domain-containing protein [Polyangiaceae bacterium]
MAVGYAMARSRAETTEKILEALDRVLTRDGVRGVGINAVAREAGVDKVLIYRYFGGMQELLRAFAERSEVWPSLRTLEGDPNDGHDLGEVFVRLARAIRQRHNTQQVLCWELIERNELIDSVASVRQEQTQRLLSRMPSHESRDLPAIAAVAAAGLTYLALRARSSETFAGVPLRTDDGWERLERAALDIWKLARARDDDAHPEAKRSSKRRKTRATSASTRREPAALRRRS